MVDRYDRYPSGISARPIAHPVEMQQPSSVLTLFSWYSHQADYVATRQDVSSVGSVRAYDSTRMTSTSGAIDRRIFRPISRRLPSLLTRCVSASSVLESAPDACVRVYGRRVVNKISTILSIPEQVHKSRPPFAVLHTPHSLFISTFQLFVLYIPFYF